MVRASAAPFAIVRPRVISPHSGEVLLLEDVVATHLAAGKPGVIEITGGPLSGKTTAIEYLDRQFAREPELALIDEDAKLQNCLAPVIGLTISTAPAEHGLPVLGKYHLAPWGQDEWIEYLLAAHKSRCSSVMSRLNAGGASSSLGGNPGLWRMVLDEFAADDSQSSAAITLRLLLDRHFADSSNRFALRNFALIAAAPLAGELDAAARALATRQIERPLLRLLGLPPVQIILAAQDLTFRLQEGELHYLQRRFPPALLHEMAPIIHANHALQVELDQVLANQNKTQLHAMAASLLHAADERWKPVRSEVLNPNSLQERSTLPDLSHAYLVEAQWPGIDLGGARLSGAQFTSANLENACLDEALVSKASFSGAVLRGASLARLNALDAGFTKADLSLVRAPHAHFRSDLAGADFTGALLTDACFTGGNVAGARFLRANLSGARFVHADITDADFSHANLQGSSLHGLDLRLANFAGAAFKQAGMRECNLEGMELSGADFEGAMLSLALLTGSIMREARFRGADLRGAGLADVDWEGADLRNADLRHASFHLGSTRCGLVGSPYPSHGTRTGFYTDDYNEQDFKAPEEIRKANLCGADLRGANITEVDFYLVDLRDAKYDPEQRAHLQQCGAILKARAV
jgi:uncharacterized protein YjbI with pentapeptide repeats